MSWLQITRKYVKKLEKGYTGASKLKGSIPVPKCEPKYLKTKYLSHLDIIIHDKLIKFIIGYLFQSILWLSISLI